jgi:hypothetical protein
MTACPSCSAALSRDVPYAPDPLGLGPARCTGCGLTREQMARRMSASEEPYVQPYHYSDDCHCAGCERQDALDNRSRYSEEAF